MKACMKRGAEGQRMQSAHMAPTDQKRAAREFVQHWQNMPCVEEEHARSFWIELLEKVLCVANATRALEFERKVKGRKIDVFYEDRGILIEMKGRGISLDKTSERSKRAGEETPYQQACWYAANLPYSIRPRWLITCNFDEFRIYDQERGDDGFISLTLEELPNQLRLLSFFTDESNSRLVKEKELSVKAGELVGKLYGQLAQQYKNIETDAREQRSLNVLIVRLVFLLYAEDAGLLHEKDAVLNYLRGFSAGQMRQAVIDLFAVLDTPPQQRDPYLPEVLLAFPYVNGGLFGSDDIIVPQFTEQIRLDLLLEASQSFDWSGISPTIFGAVFESTLNPATRRAGGMHYTSIENIHKVIDPLFLNDLKDELIQIEGEKVERNRKVRLKAFQRKLASITVFDPACGSGNFLTESYLSLRKLENRVLEDLQGEQVGMAFDAQTSPIQINISQFYGIEINDFAVSVAKTALWIAEEQMMEATQEILMQPFDFLPLKSNGNIHEGNALRMDWNTVLPAQKCTFICGNPPFIGYSNLSASQKEDRAEIFGKAGGTLDYVTCWYKKAADYAAACTERNIACAFVSTNSICQGQQVEPLWKPLFEQGICIDFAYRSFVWNSEASDQAHVHVVIVGFSHDSHVAEREGEISDAEGGAVGGAGIADTREKRESACEGCKEDARGDAACVGKGCEEDAWHNCGAIGQRLLFSGACPSGQVVENINGYLCAGPNIFVSKRSKPLCTAPEMKAGGKPTDGGFLILSPEEQAELLRDEPEAARWVRPFSMGAEFINGKDRYCLWLVDASSADISSMPKLEVRVRAVADYRAKSTKTATRKKAETPWLFDEVREPEGLYVAVPAVSSERRSYVPMGFVENGMIPGNQLYFIPDAGLYEFGVLMSQVHNAWMRVVCGRLESRYRYTNTLVYNNFPWPGGTRENISTPVAQLVSSETRARIEVCAQAVLDARAAHAGKSLADLYDPEKMPADLSHAHKALDAAVEVAYGVDFGGDEEKIVAHLFSLYAQLTG